MQPSVVCFGELLLRLGAPGRELLLQTPRLDVHVGGAEANVAVALARLGHASAMVSVVPDNALGQAAIAELRKQGVDTHAIAHGEGRMGLYFLSTGALHRPSEVLYDRADSAFALAASDRVDWTRVLAGASWLHVSGITAALGPRAAEAALHAVKAARTAGVSVSFDCNYRAKLWQRWQGDASAILAELMRHADLVFGEHRDIGLALGRTFEQDDAGTRHRAAAEAAFAAFPHLQRLASTVRAQRNNDHHALSAQMAVRGDPPAVIVTAAHELVPIVDRIGAGDAFAAGVLHGLLHGRDDRESLHGGLAAACLKHSVPGDFALIAEGDIAAFLSDAGYDVRR